MLSPSDQNTLTAIGRKADPIEMSLAVQQHGANSDALSCILSGCFTRATLRERDAAIIALARIMLDHPVPPAAVALSDAQLYLLSSLISLNAGEMTLMRAVATYGQRDDALHALYAGACRLKDDQIAATLLLLSRMIVAAEVDPATLEKSSARQKALQVIGQLGASEHLADALCVYGPTPISLRHLWQGAARHEKETPSAATPQKTRVCRAALSARPSHMRATAAWKKVLTHIGQHGDQLDLTHAIEHFSGDARAHHVLEKAVRDTARTEPALHYRIGMLAKIYSHVEATAPRAH